MGIENIFGNIFFKNWKKYFEKYFWTNIYKKYFQYPSVIPFWNRETKCYNMALIKKRFGELEKKIFFKILCILKKVIWLWSDQICTVEQFCKSRSLLYVWKHLELNRWPQFPKKRPLSPNPKIRQTSLTVTGRSGMPAEVGLKSPYKVNQCEINLRIIC